MTARIVFKPGVKLHGLRPEMLACLWPVAGVYGSHGVEVCTVTSGTEPGPHKRGSLHFNGLALDFRTIRASRLVDWQRVADEVREALTDEFDVVLEATHLHVEFHPKG